ncbi:hypothetical protein IWZ03DRAFT_11791 [Phyllosticta citriasiana]|uniref:Uncharacterized protein n=1 Tax=Phyllosticta citriasiana TaxID=595635 RepID=A0ABR1L0T8_9PEZI
MLSSSFADMTTWKILIARSTRETQYLVHHSETLFAFAFVVGVSAWSSCMQYALPKEAQKPGFKTKRKMLNPAGIQSGHESNTRWMAEARFPPAAQLAPHEGPCFSSVDKTQSQRTICLSVVRVLPGCLPLALSAPAQLADLRKVHYSIDCAD